MADLKTRIQKHLESRIGDLTQEILDEVLADVEQSFGITPPKEPRRKPVYKGHARGKVDRKRKKVERKRKPLTKSYEPLLALMQKKEYTSIQDVAKKLDIGENAACMKLRTLVKLGYAKSYREGRKVYYQLR